MSLPQFSAKRIREIEDGLRHPNGKLKTDTRKPIPRVSAKNAGKVLKRAFGRTPKASRSKAMKEADKWFSEWIRLRDADEDGYVTCITSGRRIKWRQADCGHWISRAKMATRYDERNCHAQGKMANRFQGGHFLEHGLAIERIHGAGTRAILEAKAMRECKMTTADFQFIANTYKERVAWQRQHEPGKFTKAA